MNRLLYILVLSLVSLSMFAGNNKTDKASEAKAKAWVKDQQLEFIENKGQYVTTEGKPADNVLFKATYGNCDIYITDKGLSYVFVKIEEDEGTISNRQQSIDEKEEEEGEGNRLQAIGNSEENEKLSYYCFNMSLVGAHIDKANIIKEEESKQGHYNYFYAHCPEGIYDVKAYGKITIKNIYKGIDWVIYTNPNNKKHPLKYDFIVHPYADYKAIKIKFTNQQSLSLIENETKLNIQTIAGTIVEGNIYSYLTTKDHEIKSKYVINSDSTISYNVAAYDKSQTLTIDPLVWATYYGGVAQDGFMSISSDSQHNIFITGYTGSVNFPIDYVTGYYWQTSYTTVAGTPYDMFIIKFNSQGARLWATYYGGSGYEWATSLCIDSQDNVYVAGICQSINLPTQQMTGAYFHATNSGISNLMILKFNSQGVRLWATYFGGDFDNKPNSMCVDSHDNLYITGYTSSYFFPKLQLAGAYYQSTMNGMYNAFILKFNSQDSLLWSTYYGGNQTNIAYTIGTDSKDNIFITGITNSTTFPTQQMPGAYWQSNIGGDYDEFILKFNSQGVRQWATYYGGTYTEGNISLYVKNTICIDKDDNLYMSGSTSSYDFPLLQLTGAFWQDSIKGGSDAFIIKFDSLGVRKWATFYGGTNDEYGNSITADAHGNIYVAGTTASHSLPLRHIAGEYWQTNYSNIYLLRFNEHGALQWGTYYGDSSSNSFSRGVYIDKINNIYTIGELWGDSAYTINPGNGAYYDSCWNNSDDSYILKFNICFNYQTSYLQASRTNICANDTGTITLRAFGGYGDTLKWYSGSCGQNYIGNDTLLVIPSPHQTTTYYARWESYCDTSACDSIKINVMPLQFANQNATICQGQAYYIGNHYHTTAGIYIDTVNVASGCDSVITTNLTVLLSPILKDLGNDTTLCTGHPLVLDATSQNCTYLWQDYSLNSIYNVSQQGIYFVTVTDTTTNCSASDTINVYYQKCESFPIYIPNAITPNGDGLNDVFKIVTLNEFTEFKMYIFDRWGEQLFESNDKNVGWDGTYKGKPVPMDVYVYLVKGIVKYTNEAIKRAGSVTVVR